MDDYEEHHIRMGYVRIFYLYSCIHWTKHPLPRCQCELSSCFDMYGSGSRVIKGPHSDWLQQVTAVEFMIAVGLMLRASAT